MEKEDEEAEALTKQQTFSLCAWKERERESETGEGMEEDMRRGYKDKQKVRKIRMTTF